MPPTSEKINYEPFRVRSEKGSFFSFFAHQNHTKKWSWTLKMLLARYVSFRVRQCCSFNLGANQHDIGPFGTSEKRRRYYTPIWRGSREKSISSGLRKKGTHVYIFVKWNSKIEYHFKQWKKGKNQYQKVYCEEEVCLCWSLSPVWQSWSECDEATGGKKRRWWCKRPKALNPERALCQWWTSRASIESMVCVQQYQTE